MGEHTPGPWEYRAPEKEEVWGPAIYASGAYDRHMEPLAAATTEADARLIAAAPDLLAALEEIDSDNEWQTCGDSCVEFARPRIRAAIAKAKDES
jgi:hypothetical protein